MKRGKIMAKDGEKKPGFFKEFKEFIARGNVMDMAVGVVIGAAFTAVVNSLVTNIINPVIGLATGGIDFGKLKVVLKAATADKPELAITYGVFINAVINFIIVALVIFMFIRSFNKLKAKADAEKLRKQKEAEEAAAAEAAKIAAENPPQEDPQITLLKEIRDELKRK